jgi:hypothetical protein
VRKLLVPFLLSTLVFDAGAEALYGGFSSQSPPGPTGPGTVWSVVVNSAALTSDPNTLDFAFPTGPTKTYSRRYSERKDALSLTWIGSDGRDEAIVHAEAGVVTGVIFNGARHFELEASQSGTKFEWVDQRKAGEPARPPVANVLEIPPARLPEKTATRVRESSIDVLFVYTPQAIEAVGGAAGNGLINLTSQINSAVAVTNNAFRQSNANTRINVAAIEAAPAGINDTCIPPAPICQSPTYGEAINIDLDTIQQNAIVAARRNAVRADTVVLIINEGGSGAPPFQAFVLCGVARQLRTSEIGNFGPFAYSVVKRSCATGNLTLAHELGHNFGLEHHPFEYGGVLPPDPTFAWSFAHSVGGTTAGFHSLMSTDQECISQGLNCSLIPRLSNPENTWPVNNGGVITEQPTGIPNLRDNARALRATGVIAEDWRAAYFDNGFE